MARLEGRTHVGGLSAHAGLSARLRRLKGKASAAPSARTAASGLEWWTRSLSGSRRIRRSAGAVEDVLPIQDLAGPWAYPEVGLYELATLDEPAVGEFGDAALSRALRMAAYCPRHGWL